LTHLGAERINKRLPLIREVSIKFLGIDPITQPIPIRPVAHYSMGGIEADIDGRTKAENIWAAGEVACHSMHGANRLGCNSTAECLVWGAITGRGIAEYWGQASSWRRRRKAGRGKKRNAFSTACCSRPERRIQPTSARASGIDGPARGRLSHRRIDGGGLDKIAELRRRFRNIAIADKSRIYNSNLIRTLETETCWSWPRLCCSPSGAPGIPRSACPHGFPHARRREVSEPLDGLLDGRHAEAGL